MTASQRKILVTAIPFVLAVLILGMMALILNKDAQRRVFRAADLPPTIEFTWTPAGEASLMDIQAMLTIKDDFALDFTTYRMKLVEAERELDLPIPGLIGKDYEQPVSFSLLSSDPKMADKTKLTVEITIADDKGQSTTVTKVIPLKPSNSMPFDITFE